MRGDLGKESKEYSYKRISKLLISKIKEILCTYKKKSNLQKEKSTPYQAIHIIGVCHLFDFVSDFRILFQVTYLVWDSVSFEIFCLSTSEQISLNKYEQGCLNKSEQFCLNNFYQMLLIPRGDIVQFDILICHIVVNVMSAARDSS